MIDAVNGTEDFKDENSENYTFGEFDTQPTLYNCGNESINCTGGSDNGGYFYKVCTVVFNLFRQMETLTQNYTTNVEKRNDSVGSEISSNCFDSKMENKNKTKLDCHFIQIPFITSKNRTFYLKQICYQTFQCKQIVVDMCVFALALIVTLILSANLLLLLL